MVVEKPRQFCLKCPFFRGNLQRIAYPARAQTRHRHKKEAHVTQKNARLSRRNFLLPVGAGGAATAVAVVAGKQAATQATKVAGHDKRGYHETAHTNNYYRTAKV